MRSKKISHETGDLTEALIISGRRRFRPVLMTSLAAILGMLPLALAIGAGSETASATCHRRDRRLAVCTCSFTCRDADRVCRVVAIRQEMGAELRDTEN